MPAVAQEAAQDPPPGPCWHAGPVLSAEVLGSLPCPLILCQPCAWGSPTARLLGAGVRLRRPEQAPTPSQHPPRAGRAARLTPRPSAGAAPLKAGTCPHPAVTWGSGATARGPRAHSPEKSRETKPSGVLPLVRPQTDTRAGSRSSPSVSPSRARPVSPVGTVRVAPSSTSGSSGFG